MTIQSDPCDYCQGCFQESLSDVWKCPEHQFTKTLAEEFYDAGIEFKGFVELPRIYYPLYQ